MGEVTYRRDPRALWRLTLDGALLLAPGAPDPVRLSFAGGAVWDLLDRPRTQPELVAELASIFSADTATISAGLDPVLAELRDAGLVLAES